MKKCVICEKEKEDYEFSWKLKSKNKKHSQCKECKKIIDNKYYKDSNTRKDKLRNRAKKQYHYLKDYIKRLKSFGYCTKCGDKRDYVLDFHYLDSNEKEIEISKMARNGYSINKLKNELRKCILVCSNCHREIHYFETINKT